MLPLTSRRWTGGELLLYYTIHTLLRHSSASPGVDGRRRRGASLRALVFVVLEPPVHELTLRDGAVVVLVQGLVQVLEVLVVVHPQLAQRLCASRWGPRNKRCESCSCMRKASLARCHTHESQAMGTSDAKVANRNAKVGHGATEKAPWMMDNAQTPASYVYM
jgi:hypothetical protein